jgi:hypothetical protein
LLFFAGSLKFTAMQPRDRQIVRLVRRETLGREDLVRKPFPPVIWRLFLILTLLIGYLLNASGHEHGVAIDRNAAWNDLLEQLDAGGANASNDSVATELFLIQKFLKEHQTEVTVGVYDMTVFRALDHARAHLQKADKDLETIRDDLSYKEFQARKVR